MRRNSQPPPSSHSRHDPDHDVHDAAVLRVSGDVDAAWRVGDLMRPARQGFTPE